ncbi:hypothetical protein [Streptomyces sp. NPDC048644]|uniref:hypothetical protein n=1 Tax=Streptomyces sp. NPDC048644 TaxID=3365582 RepID=UPI00371DEEE0
MVGHLPYSEHLVRDYLTHIHALPRPVQPIGVQHPNWSALGHAVDYRIRLSLGGQLPRGRTLPTSSTTSPSR